MNEQMNNTNAAFMEVTSRKVDGQDKKISALEERIKTIPDNTELIKKLESSVAALRNDIKNYAFPAEKVQDFSTKLDSAIGFLKEPVQGNVIHQHHVPKIIWITAGLFVVLSLACAGWYITGSKLDSYIANDTKYRQIRLDTANRELQLYLDEVDSMFKIRPDIRKVVLETEEEYRLNFERLQKAERLKREAKELEMKAKRR